MACLLRSGQGNLKPLAPLRGRVGRKSETMRGLGGYSDLLPASAIGGGRPRNVTLAYRPAHCSCRPGKERHNVWSSAANTPGRRRRAPMVPPLSASSPGSGGSLRHLSPLCGRRGTTCVPASTSSHGARTSARAGHAVCRVNAPLKQTIPCRSMDESWYLTPRMVRIKTRCLARRFKC